MLDIHFIRANVEQVKAAVAQKKLTTRVDVDSLLKLDQSLISERQVYEALLQQKNAVDTKMKAAKDAEERTALIEEGKKIKVQAKELEIKVSELEGQLNELLLQLPNVTSERMPVGKSEDENIVARKWGEPTQFSFTPKDHVELGQHLDIIDCETSGEVSGSRFFYLKGAGVLLQFALVQFVFQTLANKEVIKACADKVGNPFYHPFVPMLPPIMMKPEVMKKMDRLDPLEERYVFAEDNLVLVGSAEHTMGSYHMNKLWQEGELPVRYIGYSTAFRREAGSYGKDVRGILRVHQFDKMEMETFVPVQHGQVEQDLIVALQEYIVQQLKIPYQVIQICTGDTGKPDYNQYDIECWIPAQNRYRETHTSDYMTDFQARRLNIRYKDSAGKNQYVHMNDATAMAIPRILIAILENYQQEDGSVLVPDVLQPYVGLQRITPIA